MANDRQESFEERRARWCGLRESVNLISVSQVGLFLLALAFVLHRGRAVLLPVLLAVLATLMLHPVYRAIRRCRVPGMAASAMTVAGLLGIIGFGAYQLVEPGARWMDSIDREVVSMRMQEVFRPVSQVRDEIQQMANQVEEVTKNPKDAKRNEAGDEEGRNATSEKAMGDAASEGDPKGEESPPEPDPVVVEIKEDPLDGVTVAVQDLGLGFASFLILVLFMLAYGGRIVRGLSEHESAGVMLERMGKDVSRYLGTITLINFVLGIAIGLAMWLLGMPNPALWGVVAMLLNFIPYVGAMIGTGVVFLVAAASFDTPSAVLVVPIVYFVLTAIEGNFVTPMLLGGRFRLNPLVVFLWIFAWAGFWGIAGMLVAMPSLVSFKIVCENTDTMKRFRNLLTT
ncbi:MAG: AI-2E family transporter [Verrucomicrobiae bacterium]|nr:AI-2E family transporter [Verrucomicrobiae bacterium]